MEEYELFYLAIREALSLMDLETSLLFMERFNEKLEELQNEQKRTKKDT